MAVDTAPTELPDAAPSPATHPLDPLSGAEIERAASIVLAGEHRTDTLRFVMISLAEPAKPAGLVFDPAAPPPREAFVVAYDGAQKMLFEGVVDVGAGVLVSWTPVPGRFPSYLAERVAGVERVVVADDPRWQAAMRKRGVTDFSLAMVDPWSARLLLRRRTTPPAAGGAPLTFIRAAPEDNGYARPVEGVIYGVRPRLGWRGDRRRGPRRRAAAARKAGNYDGGACRGPGKRPRVRRLRDDLKPIAITQPEGASFRVDGHASSGRSGGSASASTRARAWCSTRSPTRTAGGTRRYSTALGVRDGRALRRPEPTHRRKNVFEMGEYSIGLHGQLAGTGLRLPRGDPLLRRAWSRQRGTPYTIRNAVCMHEEDSGIGWKHTDLRTEEVEVRRSRRLVVSTSRRSGTTSTASSGTSSRTARSSTRSR